MISPLNLV